MKRQLDTREEEIVFYCNIVTAEAQKRRQKPGTNKSFNDPIGSLLPPQFSRAASGLEIDVR